MDAEHESRGPSAMGRRIARLRMRLGYRKPADFADAAGVLRSIITKLETGGTQSAEPETLRKIAAKLGVTVDALIAPGDDDEAPGLPTPALPAYGQPAVPADGLSPQDAAQLVEMVNEYIRTHRR